MVGNLSLPFNYYLSMVYSQLKKMKVAVVKYNAGNIRSVD